MSMEIDERIVEMQFDNEQFERGVSESIGTLGRLKKELNFDGAETSLSDLQRATEKTSHYFMDMDDVMEVIKNQFSALDVIAISVLTRIANKVVDISTHMAKELTIAPVTTGLDEYEQKMDNIQTTLVNSGASLNEVTETLDSLNYYADKTIYKFSDMTTALGKFTIAGIDLNEAKLAIEGIGNAAAMSGLKAAQASSAYYMISQAYSSGVMRTYQFRTLETTGFASRAFRQHLLDAAVAYGTLTKEADGTYRTVEKGSEVTVENLRNTLDELWATKDVLNKVFLEYADDTTEFGQEAYKAAQQIKTASQLWDTLKEAAQSGWAKNWEYITGDYYQAIELWGNINKVVSSALEKMSNTQAEALKYWNQSKEWDISLHKNWSGRDYAIQGLANAFWSLMLAVKPIQEALSDVIGKLDGKKLTDFSKKLYDISTRFVISTSTANKLKDTFRGLFAVFGILKEVIFQTGSYIINNILPKLSWIPNRILDITSSIGSVNYRIYEFMKTNNSLYSILLNLNGAFGRVVNNITNLFSRIRNGIGYYDGLNKIGFVLSEVIFTALESIGSILERYFNIDISGGITRLENSLTNVGKVFKNIASYIGTMMPSLSEFFSGLTGDWKGLSASERLAKVISAIGNGVFTIASAVINLVTTVTGNLIKAVKQVRLSEIIDALLSGAIAAGISSVVSQISNLLDPLGDFGEMVNNFREDLQIWGNSIKIDMLKKFAIALGIFAASIYVLSKVNTGGLVQAGVALAFMLKILMTVSNALVTLTSDLMLPERALPTLFMLGSTMLKVSASVGILALALSKIGKLKLSEVAKGLGAVLVLLGGLYLLMKKFATGMGSMKEVFSKEGGLFGAKTWSKSSISTTASAILKLAVAISVLTIPILILGKMKFADLIQGVTAIGSLFVIFGVFSKLTNGMDLKVTGRSLLTFSMAVLVMTASLGLLAKINDKPILDAALALGAMFAIFGIFAKLTNGLDLKKTASALLTYSASMLIMSVSIRTLSKIGKDSAIFDGVLALGSLIAVFGGFLKLTSSLDSLGSAAGLLIFSAAVAVMSVSLTALSMAGANAYTAAVALTVLMSAFGIFAEFTNGKKLLAASAALTLFGVAVTILAADLTALSLLPTGNMLISLVALAGIIALLVKNSIALGLAAPDIALFGASLIPLGIACALIAGAALMATGAIYVLIAAVGEAISVVTGGAADVVSVIGTVFKDIALPTFESVGSLLGITVADGLKTGFEDEVKSINWGAILNGALYYGTFGRVGQNPKDLPSNNNLDKYAEEYEKKNRATGSSSGSWGDDVNYNNDSRKNARKASKATANVYDAVIDTAEDKGEELEDTTKLTWDSIKTLGTDFWKYVTGEETDTSKLDEKTQKVIESVTSVKDEFIGRYGLSNVIETVEDKAGDLADTLTDELSDAMGGLAGNTDDALLSLDSITQTLKNQINILEEFDEGTEITVSEILNNMSSNISGIFNWSSNISRLAQRGLNTNYLNYLVGLGVNGHATIEAFAQATDEEIAELNSSWEMYEQVSTLAANQAADSLKYSAEMVSKEYSDALDAYIFSVDAVGITNASLDDVAAAIRYNNDVVEAARELANKTKKTLLDSLATVGHNVTTGLANGINNGATVVHDSVQKLTSGVVSTAMFVLDEHSPSKVFYKIGQFLTAGFRNGIAENDEEPISAVAILAENTVSALESVLNDVDTEMSFSPKITPVIDISNVQNGADSINSLLSQREAIMASMTYQANVDASKEAAMQLQLNAIETAVDRIGSSIVDAILSTSDKEVGINVTVSPDSAGLFRMVRAENTKFRRANGYNALA